MPIIIVINILCGKRKSDIALLILLFLLSLCIGAYMYEYKLRVLERYDCIEAGEELCIKGKVSNIWESTNGFSIEIKLNKDDVKALCYFQEFSHEIGREVTIVGKKENVGESSNPGQFDLKEYYNSKEIFLVLKDCSVKSHGDEYSEVFHMFYLARQSLKYGIINICSETEAGVLCAMLFGDKEYIDDGVKDLYTMSGIGHILTISGLHISLAGGMVYKLMRRFVRQPAAFLVSSSVMLCFCGISGASVSTVRAVIMYMINIFAQVLGRKYDIKNAMAIALIWILADNPLYINNGGFILSFLSVVGIGFVLSYANELFKDVTSIKVNKITNIKQLILFFSIRASDALITSSALYFVTLMVIADFYYEVPMYSVILNALLLPLMGVIVISGFLGGIAFYLAEPLGQIVIMSGVFMLKLYKIICGLFMKLPFNVCVTGGKSMWQIVVYYVVLVVIVAICVVLKRKKCGLKWIVSVLSVGILILLWLVLSKPVYAFNITFLDVGQGDCIYIESPEGKNYLIDGGSTDESNIAQYKLEPFLKHRGRKSLTAVFITHTDTDHISGIVELLENNSIQIENLIFGKYMPQKTEAYDKLFKLADKRNVKVLFIDEGDMVGDLDTGVEFLCLSPIANYDYEDINAASIVLLCTYKNFKFLLTGDIGKKEEKAIIEGGYGYALDNLLLQKAAHHGSRYSNCQELLDVAKPLITVISCGEGNMYGHPHKEVIERLNEAGSEVFITKDCGAVSIGEVDGKLCVECYLEGRREGTGFN